jgi:peptidoglycan/xylan/chitin deacetylase (PgdA/CDA1 family)
MLFGLYRFYKYRGLIEPALARPRVHFVYMHHVFRDEEKEFIALLEWLVEAGHNFISYSEGIDRVVRGDIDKAFVCFTFDDGFKSCLRASQILKEFGASACFFLNDLVIDQPDHTVVKGFCQKRLKMPAVEFLTWADVEEILVLGHEIGGHTTSHINMALTAEEIVRKEVEDNLVVLTKHCGPIKHFSWPYGEFIHFNVSARNIVYAAGYETCASAVRGCHVVAARDRSFCVRREKLVAAWPLEHVGFFLANSALQADEMSNFWNSHG